MNDRLNVLPWRSRRSAAFRDFHFSRQFPSERIDAILTRNQFGRSDVFINFYYFAHFFLYVFVLLCCAHLTFTAAVKRKMFRRMKGSAPLVGGACPTRPISDATFKWKTKWEKCKWNFHQLWTADEFHHKSDEFNEIFD